MSDYTIDQLIAKIKRLISGYETSKQREMIVKLRRLGWTQRQIADLFNYTPETISRKFPLEEEK